MSSEDPFELFSFVNHHHDEEILKLAKDLMHYASKGLKDLRKEYPKIPKELQATEAFYKDLVLVSSEYLVKTRNWYPDDKDNTLP
ncbi:MAG: hypothetical protein E6Q36_00830 [Chryseobacterium sp.]|nr:MAG: hypothetical protein E6Q36_00830 [Chryseobacterium sp.]